MTLHDIYRLVLLVGFFVIAVRHLQDSMLLRLDRPPVPTGRKWLLAALTALLLGAVDVGATLAAIGLLVLSPLLALIVVKPIFWAVGALPFIWLFRVPFFTALKASAWAVLCAVVGDLLTRMMVFLVGGTLLARPLPMLGGLAGVGALAAVILLVRRRQHQRLVALASEDLSPAEQAQIARELDQQPLPAPAQRATAEEQAVAYCPSCASPAPLDAQRCPSCGSTMDQLELDLLAQQPLQGRWLAIFVGGTGLLLALVSLTPLVNKLFLGMQFPHGLALAAVGSEAASRLPVVVTGGFLGLGALLLLFAGGGVTMGAVARRPIYRELAVGGVALALVSWLIWAGRAGSNAGLLLSNQMMLVDFAGQALMTGPMPVFLLAINLLGLVAALGSARLGVLIAERMTGETVCYRCGRSRPLQPALCACPSCGMPARRAGAVDWRWVGAVAGATMVIFVLVTRLGGPALSFYWSCDFAQPSAACREAWAGWSSELMVLKAARTFDSQPGIILHPWKYVGLLAPLFLVGPLLIAWRAGRVGMRSAGLAIGLNAAGTTLASLVLLGFALGGRGFTGAVQVQLLAALAWSVAGAIGIAIGNKLRPANDFAEALAALEPAQPHQSTT